MNFAEDSLSWGGFTFSSQAVWERNGERINGQQHCDTDYAPIPLLEVPAAARFARELEAEGYACTGQPQVSRCRSAIKWEDGREDHGVSFCVGFTLHARRGNAELIWDVRGGGRDPTEAVTAATVCPEPTAHFREAVIAGGKGQASRCLQAARSVFTDHPRAQAARWICVDYRTRAGRGGWREKIATRNFRPLDVIAATLAPAPAPSPPGP
jgi:hypothetical protein